MRDKLVKREAYVGGVERALKVEKEKCGELERQISNVK